MKQFIRKCAVIFITLGIVGGAIQVMRLSADTINLTYTHEDVLVTKGTLTSAQIFKDAKMIATCSYPDTTEELCHGFIQKDDGIYRNAGAYAGVMEQDGFHPYRYDVTYTDEQGNEMKQEFSLQRAEGTAILSFQGKELEPDIEYELNIVGTYHSVSFQASDERVEIKDGKVKAPVEVSEFTIIAKDDGNEAVSGGEVTAVFTVKQPQQEADEATQSKTNTTEKEIPKEIQTIDEFTDIKAFAGVRSLNYSYDGLKWRNGPNTIFLDMYLKNDGNSYGSTPEEKAAYKNQIVIQGQFVNLLDGVHSLPIVNGVQKQPSELTLADIQTLFKGQPYIDGTGFDTTQDYQSGTTRWAQTLQLNWPDEEGIFLMRYRIYSYVDKSRIPMENIPDNLIYDTKNASLFDSSLVIGQDFVKPTIALSAKAKEDSDYHELLEEEVLKSGDTIRISASDDLSGIQSLKYKLVADDEIEDEIAFTDAKETESVDYVIPEGFAGGTLYVEARDGNGNNGLTQESSHIQGQVDYILVNMPSETLTWTSNKQATLKLNEPTDKVIEYDGILVSYDNYKPDEFIAKETFKNNQNLATIELPNGSYTLRAKAVKVVDGANVAIDSHVFTSRQYIDNTSTLSLSEQSVADHVLPITLNVASGPSNIKEVKVACENTDGTTWTKSLVVSGNKNTATMKDQLKVNATCTYTAYNNANLASETKTVTSTGLNYPHPVLILTATDSTGIELQSGKEASQFVTLKAINVNPNTSKKTKVCRNGTCDSSDYVYGNSLRILENTNITFVNSDDLEEVYESFEVVIGNSVNFGTIAIEQEDRYGTANWFKEDQTIHAALTNHDEGVALAYRIDDGAWNHTNQTTLDIPVTQETNTSALHHVEVRSYKANEASSSKRVEVQIDKKTPKLTITKTLNAKNTKAAFDFGVEVGGSGIQAFGVKDTTGNTVNLSSLITGITLSSYSVDQNSSYTFTLTNGVGTTVSETISVSEIADGILHIETTIDNQLYDGGWTNKDVTIKWSGGMVDPDDIDHYECKVNNGNWTVCTSPMIVNTETDQTMQIRPVDKNGDPQNPSDPITIRIDKTDPVKPTIKIQKINTGAIPYFIRSITFDQFYNEAVEAVMECEDTQSPITIYYQEADEEGKFDKDKTSPRWKTYTKALTFDVERSLKLQAYACDAAGNCSASIDSDGVLIDITPPVFHGIKEEEKSGYIPRKITYEDQLSDLDETMSTLFFNTDVAPLSQGMMIKETGSYEFAIYDKAGNITTRTFELKRIPTPDEVDGDDAWKEIIDQIKDELEQNKDNLDEETIKNIEDQIKDIEDAFQAQRVDELKDIESGAVITGKDGTTFPKDALLTVTKITEHLSEEELKNYLDLAKAKELEIKDIYEVKLTRNGTEITLTGKADLAIPYQEAIDQLMLIEQELQPLFFEQDKDQIITELTTTGRIAFLMNASGSEDPNDPNNNHPNDDGTNSGDANSGNGTNGNGSNGTTVKHSFGGNINTGDVTYSVTWMLIVTLSALTILIIVLKNKRSEHK